MSNERTPGWVCQLRFYALCLPVGVVAAVLLLPFAVPLLLGFGVTLFASWHFTRFVSNGFVRLADPESYQIIRDRGVDPFTTSLGPPLNFDSGEVRQRGLVHNSSCPVCDDLIWIEWGVAESCSSCGACWHNDRWWQWDGKNWNPVRSN